MVDSGFVDGGSKGRKMGVLMNFQGFYSRGLECAQPGDPGGDLERSHHLPSIERSY